MRKGGTRFAPRALWPVLVDPRPPPQRRRLFLPRRTWRRRRSHRTAEMSSCLPPWVVNICTADKRACHRAFSARCRGVAGGVVGCGVKRRQAVPAWLRTYERKRSIRIHYGAAGKRVGLLMMLLSVRVLLWPFAAWSSGRGISICWRVCSAFHRPREGEMLAQASLPSQPTCSTNRTGNVPNLSSVCCRLSLFALGNLMFIQELRNDQKWEFAPIAES